MPMAPIFSTFPLFEAFLCGPAFLFQSPLDALRGLDYSSNVLLLSWCSGDLSSDNDTSIALTVTEACSNGAIQKTAGKLYTESPRLRCKYALGRSFHCVCQLPSDYTINDRSILRTPSRCEMFRRRASLQRPVERDGPRFVLNLRPTPRVWANVISNEPLGPVQFR